MLTWYGRRQGLLHVQPAFRRALFPIVLAAVAAGAGAYGGATLVGMGLHLHTQSLRDLVALAAAGLIGGVGYGAVVLVFRRRLPLAR
jgi:putative peptidoglycan lipid II flippase